MKDSETPERRSDNPRRFQFGLRSLFAATTLLAFMLGMWQIFGLLVVGAIAFVVTFLMLCYRKPGYGISLLGMGLFVSLFLPVMFGPRGLGRRALCMNNLKNITLALLNYEASHGCFPPAYLADENGKPMHSWRVLILPYIARQDLYEAYRFDEPWDGPNNRKLHNVVIDLFKCPSDTTPRNQPNTSYLAVVGPHVAWAGERGRKWEEFSDGSQDTILLVETANSGIHWMEPRDITLEEALGKSINNLTQVPSSEHYTIGGYFHHSLPLAGHIVMADGSVKCFCNRPDADELAAMLRTRKTIVS